jgi:hypothetical protein
MAIISIVSVTFTDMLYMFFLLLYAPPRYARGLGFVNLRVVRPKGS